MRKLLVVLALVISACTAPIKNKNTDAHLYDISSKTVLKVITISGSGSGVLIAPDLVLTAYHVIENAGNAIAVSSHDSLFSADAVVVQKDPESDLALLRINKKSPDFMALSTEMPPFGARVNAVGYPLGIRLFITDGRYQGPIKYKHSYAVSAPIIFGNSGGPVIWFDSVDNRYEVVGIAVAMPHVAGIPISHMTFFRGLTDIQRVLPGLDVR